MIKKLLLALFVLCAVPSYAETLTFKHFKVTFHHKCADFDWPCVNEVQAADTQETIDQIQTAIRHAKFRGFVTIISIDPRRNKKGNVWFYDVKRKGRKIYFSAMPGCTNTREMLEDLLKHGR